MQGLSQEIWIKPRRVPGHERVFDAMPLQHFDHKIFPTGERLHSRRNTLQERGGLRRITHGATTLSIAGIDVPIRADWNKGNLDPVKVFDQPIATGIHRHIANRKGG